MIDRKGRFSVTRISSACLRSPGRTRNGSTLTLTLLLVGVLAISVASMLASVRHLSHSADDKIAEEECYQTALAGLNVVKGWMMQPGIARNHYGDGGTLSRVMESVTSGAESLSIHVYTYRNNTGLLNAITADQIRSDWYQQFFTDNGVALNTGTITEGGNTRAVIYDTGANLTNKPIVLRRGDAFSSPTVRIFNSSIAGVAGQPGTEGRSWVERIRITTPNRNSANPDQGDDLRLTSLIIEVQARTMGAGVIKERTVAGRVLVIPQITGVPPAQSGAAIVAGAALTTGGNNPFKVHWGAVWAKGNLTVPGFTTDFTGGNRELISDNDWGGNGNPRYTGIGSPGEKWLRYLTAGTLQNHNGVNLFPATVGANNVPVTDLVAQILRGEIKQTDSSGQQVPWQLSDITLTNFRPNSLSAINPVTNEPVYYNKPVDENGNTSQALAVDSSGPFVQKTPVIADMVDASFNSLDYTTWKNFAIANKGYMRPKAGGGFMNSAGQMLYVTSQRTLTTVSSGNTLLTDLSQISMKNLIPNDLNTAGIPDRILFIDTYQGTPTGTPYDLKINSQDKFFWKGLLFVNGDFTLTGSGQMSDAWGKNPDQYYNSPPDPYNRGDGQILENCMMDGILRVTGACSGGANSCVFGSIVAGMPDGGGGFNANGAPHVYYNERCRDGLFKAPRDPRTRGIVSGPIVELRAML